MNAPARWERLLGVSSRRCLAYLRKLWEQRPEGQPFVAATFDDLVDDAGVPRSAVRRSLNQLIEVGLIEAAGSVPSGRGHPRNAFRVLQ